jgi:hypothetical protein
MNGPNTLYVNQKVAAPFFSLARTHDLACCHLHLGNPALAQNQGWCEHGAGIKLAVVSNFDTRLRPLLTAMGAAEAFDALVISAEVTASSILLSTAR